MAGGPVHKDELFAKPSHDELFYAKALHIMAKPTRRFWFIMRVLRAIYWFAMTCVAVWIGSQALDRELPSKDLVAVADPTVVVAGNPVMVHSVVIRNKLCEASVRWEVMSGVNRKIQLFGPVITYPFSSKIGRDEFTLPYDTSVDMVPGPATLLIYKSYKCPGNYLSGLVPIQRPVVIVPFVIAASPARTDHHDTQQSHPQL